MSGSLVTVSRVRQALLLSLALVVVLALSFVAAVKPAQAQVLPTGPVLNAQVEVEQGECGEGGCPPDQRPVTVTSFLTLNEDLTALLTDEQEQAVLDAANAVVEFGDVTITSADGDVVATVGDGGTVCLEPGTYTASPLVLNPDVTADAALAALAPLGIDLTGLVADVLVVEGEFVVEECPAGGPGAGGNQRFGDITLRECSAIINNTGVQYGPEITQRCIDIIRNNGGGGDGGITNVTIDLNGDGLIDDVDAEIIADAGIAAGTGEIAAATAAADGGDGSATESSDAAAATGGMLPETGGASLIALAAGALLVAGGLLARRFVR